MRKTLWLSLFSFPLLLFGSQNYCHEPLLNESSCELPRLDAFTYPGRINLDSSWGMGLGGSFLYWQARQSSMDIGEMLREERLINQNYEYKPGFETFLIIKPPLDHWTARFAYTWYRSVIKTAVDTAPGEIIILRFTDQTADLEKIRSNWLLQLHMINAELGRPCFLGKKLVFHPFMSGQFFFIDQRLAIEGQLLPDAQVTNPDILLVASTEKKSTYVSKAWAVGPRTGCNLDFLLGAGFHTFLNAAASLLYFDYKVNMRQETDLVGVLQNFRDRNGELRSCTELATGFGWNSYFHRNRFYLDLSAVFDIKIITGQNVMRQLVDGLPHYIDTHCGALYLFGGRFSLRFDF